VGNHAQALKSPLESPFRGSKVAPLIWMGIALSLIVAYVVVNFFSTRSRAVARRASKPKSDIRAML
jgi:hypothetical protein